MEFKQKAEILKILEDTLGPKRLGIYLYGSLLHGQPKPLSDIDLLVLLKEPLGEEVRKNVVSRLLRISAYPPAADGTHPLEVTFVLHDNLSPWRHPVKRELLFGEWLRADFEAGKISPAIFDPDLTLVLAQARQLNKKLAGPDLKTLVPNIPQSDIQKAIFQSLPGLIEFAIGDERNVLLTMVRMIATLETCEFFPKDRAVDKMITRLPSEHRDLLRLARDAYLGLRKDDWASLRAQVEDAVHAMESIIMSKAGAFGS